MSSGCTFGHKAQYLALAKHMRKEILRANSLSSDARVFAIQSAYTLGLMLSQDNVNFEIGMFLDNCGLKYDGCKYKFTCNSP